MGRYSSSQSTGQKIQRLGADWWRMYWTVDYYYPTSRVRFPRVFSRDTDDAGAARFARKWGLRNGPEKEIA